MNCGLDAASGLDDHGCQSDIVGRHAPGTVQACWVHEDTLEVSWEQPEWNNGCWVGIGIGGLLLLPCAMVLILGFLLFLRYLLQECWAQLPNHSQLNVHSEKGPSFSEHSLAGLGVKNGDFAQVL